MSISHLQQRLDAMVSSSSTGRCVPASTLPSVDPDPGPVLANYGLENLRFNQPVYPGDRIKVAFTCKQKVNRETAEYGEAHWDVQATNQDDENVASYEVLTLVQKAHWVPLEEPGIPS